jgi:hypothetical protein
MPPGRFASPQRSDLFHHDLLELVHESNALVVLDDLYGMGLRECMGAAVMYAQHGVLQLLVVFKLLDHQTQRATPLPRQVAGMGQCEGMVSHLIDDPIGRSLAIWISGEHAVYQQIVDNGF